MSEAPDPANHNSELHDLSDAAPGEVIEELESDLQDIYYQQQIMDAAVLEGVDIGIFAAYTGANPDPTLQRTIHDFFQCIESAKERTLKADIDGTYDVLEFTAASIEHWKREHNFALGVQQTAWARLHIDKYGVDPSEAKISTQLELYTLPGFSPEERQIWLRILDRIIPEVPGLDPNDPQTAAEIEERT